MSQRTLLVWATYRTIDRDDADGVDDHWMVFDSVEEALFEYNLIAKDRDVYSASVCGVIKSTDYSPTMEVQS